MEYAVILDPDKVLARLTHDHYRTPTTRELVTAICAELDAALLGALDSLEPDKLERAGIALAERALRRDRGEPVSSTRDTRDPDIAHPTPLWASMIAYQNARVDNTVYGMGVLTSARLRVFASPGACLRATDNAANGTDGEVARYTLTTVDDGINMPTSYTVTRDDQLPRPPADYLPSVSSRLGTILTHAPALPGGSHTYRHVAYNITDARPDVQLTSASPQSERPGVLAYHHETNSWVAFSASRNNHGKWFAHLSPSLRRWMMPNNHGVVVLLANNGYTPTIFEVREV